MKNILRSWWNADWTFSKPIRNLYLIIIIVGLFYTFAELFLKFGNPGLKFGIYDIIPFLRHQVSYRAPGIVKIYFPYIWLVAAISCYTFRVYMIISSYFASLKMFDAKTFQRDLLVYLTSALIALLSTFIFFRIIGLIYWLSGHDFINGVNIIKIVLQKFQDLVNIHVPTLIELPYPVALLTIFLGFTLSSLAGYLVHWLAHQSRFLWLVTHRAHHTPEMLHPLGAPLAFNFDFILVFPSLIFNILFTKLFYTDSLILETTIVLIFYYNFEIFNHSAAHYDVAYHNKFLRFFFYLTGNGIYHYMHHSSEEGKDAVNLGAGMFLFWDRIFGTYAKPPEIKPATGLTNNPKIRMNPFRVNFSGFAQIGYELRHNKNRKERFLIIFGSIWYKPTVSKEYLILYYPAQ